MSSTVNQGKYFLVEETQARLSSEETCVEIGFRLHNVELSLSKAKSRPAFRFRGLFSKPSSSSLPPSFPPTRYRQSDASDMGSTISSLNSASTRTSKMNIPQCMLQVYCYNNEVNVLETTSGEAQQEWKLVYQSDTHKVINSTIPITLSTLLILPVPTIIASAGANPLDRMVRFELWLGTRRPDVLSGSFECYLGKILSQMGAPKRFPGSPSLTSCWDTIPLQNVEGVDSKALLGIRIGFPDRLISVTVPKSLHEVDVSEWRNAPLFAGPTLRGLTFSPVSKAFQATTSTATGGNTPEMSSLLSEQIKKKLTRSVLNEGYTQLMEFREEMAEMPLNLLVPANYLELASEELSLRCEAFSQRFQKDLLLIRKLATSDFALTVNDFQTPKYMEISSKLDKFVVDVVQQGRDRVLEMKELALYYREQWALVVCAGKKVAAGKKRTIRNNVGGGEGGGDSSTAPLVLEEVMDEDDEQEVELRKAYAKELAGFVDTTSPVTSSSVHSFRKSTSRKDLKVRFLPINMHLQVLTVRETLVQPKPMAKSSTVGGGLRQRLKSIATLRLVSSEKHLMNNNSNSGLPRATPLNAQPRLPRRGISKLSNTSPNMDETSGGGVGDRTSTSTYKLVVNSAAAAAAAAAAEEGGGEEEIATKEESFFYDTLSVGAPAAHSLSSKYGGCWQLWKELTKQREEFKRVRDDNKQDLFAKLDAFKKFKEVEWMMGERVDVVLSQALASLVGAVLARLYVMAAEFSASVLGGFEQPDDEVAESVIKHGFLIGWESLLSTHGKELAMLGDLHYAVRFLNEHIRLRLEVFTSVDQESSSSEEASEEELLQDTLNMKWFKTSTTTTTSNNPAVSAYDVTPPPERFIGPGGSDDEAVYLVVARIPHTVVEKLPKVMREYIESSSATPSMFTHGGELIHLDQVSPKPLTWTCVLFSQGINEMQNIAQLVGSRVLQEEINEFSCNQLVEYCSRRFAVAPVKKARKSLRVKENSSGGEDSLVLENALKEEERARRAHVAYQQCLIWAAKLRMAVSNQAQTGKSFEILQNSADLVRWLSGIRIASCKSAKDRTAMSLTWEEARILHNIHFVRELPLLELANLLREHGTRLINVHKNTGVPRYAFNKAQRSFLPDSYRPPVNTIGSMFASNLS